MHRGTSLTRKRTALGPFRRPMHGVPGESCAPRSLGICWFRVKDLIAANVCNKYSLGPFIRPILYQMMIYNVPCSLGTCCFQAIDSGWEGYRESRRCSRDTYPESYIIKHTSWNDTPRSLGICWFQIEDSWIVYRGTSSTRKRTPLGPCRRPICRVPGGSQGDGCLHTGEVPLYGLGVRLPFMTWKSILKKSLLRKL